VSKELVFVPFRQTKMSEMPVGRDIQVVVEFRNGKKSKPTPARHWRWKEFPIGPTDWDVTAYARSAT
jgi:hypothetical protein